MPRCQDGRRWKMDYLGIMQDFSSIPRKEKKTTHLWGIGVKASGLLSPCQICFITKHHFLEWCLEMSISVCQPQSQLKQREKVKVDTFISCLEGLIMLFSQESQTCVLWRETCSLVRVQFYRWWEHIIITEGVLVQVNCSKVLYSRIIAVVMFLMCLVMYLENMWKCQQIMCLGVV